jgi:predicted ATPase
MPKSSAYQPVNKPNFFLITGGPGAGKTSVLNELNKQGQLVVPEVARKIIQAQNAIGGNATHSGNRDNFCDLMLEQSIADFKKMELVSQPVFFDRGIPDLYGYSQRFCGKMNTEIVRAIQQYRYNTSVFIFPPWPEIYRHDMERQQDFQEAIETWQAIKEAHTICGYELIEVPKDTIENRVNFILQLINLYEQ